VLLLAWGVTHQGKEELIDYRVVPSESQEHWQGFLTDLEARGLRRQPGEKETLKLIVSDGDGGLEAARLMVYPTVAHQLCVFHRLQAIAAHLQERSHREAIMGEAAGVYDRLRTVAQARARLQRWRRKWLPREPEAVRCFCAEFERTLVYLSLPQGQRTRVKTSNPIERFARSKRSVSSPAIAAGTASPTSPGTTSNQEDTPTPLNTFLHTTLDTIGSRCVL